MALRHCLSELLAVLHGEDLVAECFSNVSAASSSILPWVQHKSNQGSAMMVLLLAYSKMQVD